jgi:hypothetical protein
MGTVWIEVYADRVEQVEEPGAMRRLGGRGMPHRTTIRATIALDEIQSVAEGSGANVVVTTRRQEYRLPCQAQERAAVVAAIEAVRAGEVPAADANGADDEESTDAESTDSAEGSAAEETS